MAGPKVHEKSQRPVYREGLRELNCLYAVAEALDAPGKSAKQRFGGVVELLRAGFPDARSCHVRIRVGRALFRSRGFAETPWACAEPLWDGNPPPGVLEVFLVRPEGRKREDPFTLEQKRLVKTVAQKVGRKVRAERAKPPRGRRALPAPPRPEWQVILELLDETDGALHKRVVRRLMNHLANLGVPGIQGLVIEFDPAFYADRDTDARGPNQPLPKRDSGVPRRVFQEIVQLASTVMPEEEITLLIKQWVRQDKLGFFALATEKKNISLGELSEIVQRFCREVTEEESALSPSDDTNVRVALTRRFLTDRLSFVAVAKKYLGVHDFDRLLRRVVGPAQGTGTVGGKAAGLFLASHILRQDGRGNPLLENIKVPHAWFVTSDGLFDFVHYNSLEDTQSFKYQTVEEIRHNYPYMEQVFKNSFFSPGMVNKLRMALDDLGEDPLIVRSSSLLEDSEGSAFSGKYRSLFLVNQGSREERLEALMDAIAEVYASIFGPDPIQYRRERGLLDFMEEMGIMIMRVVGTRVGKYYFPAFAGVAFSANEFRWSPRLRREDGVLRIVAGLGTRAVDRIGEDFPTMVSPGQPGLRVNVTPDQVIRYAQRYIDVLNLETGRFESPDIHEVIREVGDDFPLLEKIVSVCSGEMLHKPLGGLLDVASDDLVVTFAGLLEDSDFVRQMNLLLKTIESAIGMPVDVEFAHDGKDLHILQCRPQSRADASARVPIPTWISEERKLFSARKYVSTAQVAGVRYVVYVVPEEYGRLSSAEEMAAVGEVVSRLNHLLPRRQFILVGPGRWGSRGDITLGVRVTYADISNSAMLIEVARKKGNYVPDLSFGTHFFQDLVEAKIRYLALYPDEPGILFNEKFFAGSPNLLEELLPEAGNLARVVRVIDVREVAGEVELQVIMDGEGGQALAFLAEAPAGGEVEGDAPPDGAGLAD